VGGTATESPLASLEEAKSKRDRERRGRERGGGEEGVGMVAAGGAGLNINPRGRPGRAPVLVRFCLNSRNHAAVVARSVASSAREKRKIRACERTEGSTERRTELDDGCESTTTRWIVSDERAIGDDVVVVIVVLTSFPW